MRSKVSKLFFIFIEQVLKILLTILTFLTFLPLSNRRINPLAASLIMGLKASCIPERTVPTQKYLKYFFLKPDRLHLQFIAIDNELVEVIAAIDGSFVVIESSSSFVRHDAMDVGCPHVDGVQNTMLQVT